MRVGRSILRLTAEGDEDVGDGDGDGDGDVGIDGNGGGSSGGTSGRARLDCCLHQLIVEDQGLAHLSRYS
jgi:hypothetical protein